jgi:hypothetical protein
MYTWYLLGAILWVLVALWPAIFAKRKGYNFLIFFIISLFFWWITLFIVLMLKDKTQTAADRAADKAADKALDKEYS